MSIFTKLLGEIGLEKLINSIGDNIDRFVTTKEERENLKMAIKQAQNDFELEFLKDRQNARAMYQKDNWLQKVFAITFLIIWSALTAFIFYMVINMVHNALDLPGWAISLISAIWGGFSTKINTIVDFLFGSSQGSRDKDEKDKIS